MDIKNWEINDNDRKLALELRHFIPNKIFDIHMHVYSKNEINKSTDNFIKEGPLEVTINDIRAFYKQLLGEPVLAGGLAIAYPSVNCNIDDVNKYISKQVACESSFRGSICIKPQNSPYDTYKILDTNPSVIGLKPYHVFSNVKPSWNASTLQLAPEWVWKLADERSLIITLHLVRDKAVADSQNILEIRKMMDKYPRARLVLAHAGRSFHAPNALKGIPELLGIPNIWFDMSAICESETIRVILEYFGPKKLLWGSDYPVCMIRGRAVTIGLDFIWLQHDTVLWNELHTECRPVLVGLESLRALQVASRDMGLNKNEVEMIFHRNAEELIFGANQCSTYTL